jgi:hypothetical protein
MKNDSRIILTFDEFFKICSKTFFEEDGFRVETELEIFKLPKRLDLLVVKKPEQGIPFAKRSNKEYGKSIPIFTRST